MFGNCGECLAATPMHDASDLRTRKFICRRYPPIAHVLVAGGPNGQPTLINRTEFPLVNAQQGCWEFIGKPAEVTDGTEAAPAV